MKGGEIDVRERVAQILGKAGDTQGFQMDEAQLKAAKGRLEAAIANFFPAEFEVAAPYVEFVGDDDEVQFSNSVVVVLELHEAHAKVHVALDTESVDVLISHCFGKSSGDGWPVVARELTRFDRTVVADFAFKIVRDIWGNNSVERTVFEEADLHSLVPQMPSCLTRWSINVGGDAMTLAVYAAANLLAPAVTGEHEPAEAKGVVNKTWHAQMERALGQTSVLLDAVIEGPEMTLGDVAALRVGQVIELGDASELDVSLRCEGDILFSGEMGRKYGRFAVTIERVLGKLPEQLDTSKN